MAVPKDSIKALQAMLIDEGYSIQRTGVYDEATRKAVEDFNMYNGVQFVAKDRGIATVETLRLLGVPEGQNSVWWNEVITAAGYKKPDYNTVAVQTALRQAGFEPGPIDGILGNRTRAAIKEFQASRGLKTTGTLDKSTVSALSDATGTILLESSTGTPTPEPLPVGFEKAELLPTSGWPTWLKWGLGITGGALVVGAIYKAFKG